jgi:hypothetical protein
MFERIRRATYLGALSLVVPAFGCSDPAPREDVAVLGQPVVGGEATPTCAWPTAVYFGTLGCTGTLVHPRLVTLAAHCLESDRGTPERVFLGDLGDSNGPGRLVPVERCEKRDWANDREDMAYCVLEEPVDAAIIPIMYGCELDLLQAGEVATLVGFGYVEATTPSPGDRKRWTQAPIVEVREKTIDVGEPGHSNCFGDSGGPAYFQMPDGSWRVFGATSTTYEVDGVPCRREGTWALTPHYVPWIEETSGLDVTPCHRTDGTWHPGPDCGYVPLNPEVSTGTWEQLCHETESLSGPLSTCGEPFTSPVDVRDRGLPKPADAGGAGTGGQGSSGSAGSSGAAGAATGGAEPMSGAGTPAAGLAGMSSGGASGASALVPVEKTRAGSGSKVLGECACRAARGRGGWHTLATLLLGLGVLFGRRQRAANVDPRRSRAPTPPILRSSRAHGGEGRDRQAAGA